MLFQAYINCLYIYVYFIPDLRNLSESKNSKYTYKGEK